jgi:hypothetical protein
MAQDESEFDSASAVKKWDLFTRAEDIIEGDYKVGPALVFDCKLKAWLCVDTESFARCRREREESLKLPGMIFPCAPIIETPEFSECLRLQYLNIHIWQWKIFCLKQSSKI